MASLVRHIDYKPFFELIEEPFNTVASPRFFYLSPIHAIALNKSVSAVVNRKGVSVVYGDVGTGKSTLARIMHEHFLEQGGECQGSCRQDSVTSSVYPLLRRF